MINFIFWAMASHGPGISGGDRIYIELAKRWSKHFPVTIVTWREGIAMMARNGLRPGQRVAFRIVGVPNLGFVLTYLVRIVVGIVAACKMTVKDSHQTYLYTVSEFWMDSLPGVILKLRYPSLRWVAAWYQTAPSPLKGFSEGQRGQVYRWNALSLWLFQLPIRPLVSSLADYVLVNNELERRVFPKHDRLHQAVVLLGAVDTHLVTKWQKKFSSLPTKFAAVFQGRFHPQKGVEELIDIWQKVVTELPNARLAMIGDGPLMSKVIQKIIKLGLQSNIELFGFLFDGPIKYRIFAQSQLVVHPAFFDSGGMAAAEAMAFGLPAIGFDLPSFKSYYPEGMVKVAVGDLDAFADEIIKMYRQPNYRNHLGRQAREFIANRYSWDQRATEVLKNISI